MNRITKNLIVFFVLILILTVGFAFIVKLKKTAPRNQQSNLTRENKKSEEKIKQETRSTETISLDGIISNVSAGEIEIQIGDNKNILPIPQDLGIISIFNGKTEKREVSYLKIGQKISMAISQSDSRVISIQILEGDSDKKTF